MGIKVILVEKAGGGVIIGISKEDCDPIMSTAGGSLIEALVIVPGLITEAQEKWQTAARYPAYKAPPPPAKKVEPKKTTAAKPEPVAATPAAEELPLLAGIKPKETPAKEETTETTETPGSSEETRPGLTKEADEIKAVEPTTLGDAKVSEASGPEEPSAQVGLFLQDGRGPFKSIQEAFDILGVPANDRPHHNRYDRLSNEWKRKIIKKGG